MYVKEKDKWEKDEENPQIKKVINIVVSKTHCLIPKFREKYPDYNKYSSKCSDKYNNMLIESMGGKGDNDKEKEEKIIKNIKNIVSINKD